VQIISVSVFNLIGYHVRVCCCVFFNDDYLFEGISSVSFYMSRFYQEFLQAEFV
jgi:hypothetical protein